MLTHDCFFPSPSVTQVDHCITTCFADITKWMTAKNFKLNPDETELHFFPVKSSPTLELTISIDNTLVSP